MAKSFREVLKAARLKSGLSLRQITMETGIANSILSRIETGKMVEPSFRTVVLICGAIGYDIRKLANADIPSRCTNKLRTLRRQQLRKTLSNPKSAKLIQEGRSKGAKKANRLMSDASREILKRNRWDSQQLNGAAH